MKAKIFELHCLDVDASKDVEAHCILYIYIYIYIYLGRPEPRKKWVRNPKPGFPEDFVKNLVLTNRTGFFQDVTYRTRKYPSENP